MTSFIKDAHTIYTAAVRAVQPRGLLDGFNWHRHLGKDLSAFDRIVVAGTGKASMAMAGALEAVLGDAIDSGVITVPHNYTPTFPDDLRRPVQLEVLEAGHPVPDGGSELAAQRALELAASCGPDDLLIVPISGGGSALWSSLSSGITLEDGQATARLLLRSGANIHEINTVRKHLSRIKGGRLAQAAYPASVIALLISDVVGDDMDVIASGPTVPDPTIFADAVAICNQFEIWDHLPAGVRSHLKAGLQEPSLETPKTGDPSFEKVATVLLGTNRVALDAAGEEASLLGYSVSIETDRQVGEARDVAREQVRTALNHAADGPACLLWGGETTVTVVGEGKGGRNQEAALSALIELDGIEREIIYLSGGTDGIDGPTDAAGAWVIPDSLNLAASRDLDPASYLARNDAYSFFKELGQLLMPGPTHTNVMDIQIILIRPVST